MTKTTKKTAEQMRHAIMVEIKATGKPVSADTWFSLIFMTDSTLASLCRKLKIEVVS